MMMATATARSNKMKNRITHKHQNHQNHRSPGHKNKRKIKNGEKLSSLLIVSKHRSRCRFFNIQVNIVSVWCLFTVIAVCGGSNSITSSLLLAVAEPATTTVAVTTAGEENAALSLAVAESSSSNSMSNDSISGTSSKSRFLAILTEEQRAVSLQYIPRVPAVLSIFGSSMIMVAILSKRRGVREDPYHRMMFCLSAYDLIGACWTALGSIPVHEQYGIPGSMGNTSICDAQGFIIHFTVIGTNVYNSALIVYFLMKIRYNVSNTILKTRYEPAVHFLAFLLSLAAALTGQLLQVFNPIGFGGPSNSPLCYIQAFPPGCDFVPDMECTRGAKASSVIWYIAIAPFIAATATLLASLVLVMVTVIQRTHENKKFQYTDTPSEAITTDPNAWSMSRIKSRSNRSYRTKNQKVIIVGKRCLLYGVVFLNTFIWTSVSMIIHNEEPPEWDSFWIGCLAFLFMPLQGFLNFIIYILPLVSTLRKKNKEKSIAWAIYSSIFSNGE